MESNRGTVNKEEKKYALLREVRSLASETEYLSLSDYNDAEGTLYETGQGASYLFDDSWRKVKEAAGLDSKRDRSSEKYKSGEEYYRDAKSEAECFRCGESFGPALDFHHVDGHVKQYNIGKKNINVAPIKQKAEMAKCAVLCKNCHAKHHHDGHEFTADNMETFVPPKLRTDG